MREVEKRVCREKRVFCNVFEPSEFELSLDWLGIKKRGVISGSVDKERKRKIRGKIDKESRHHFFICSPQTLVGEGEG